MKNLLIALGVYTFNMPIAFAWDYHKNVDPITGTQKWSCVYDADHGEIPKQLCIITHVDTTTIGLSLSNGTTEICDEVEVSFKVNGGTTSYWGGSIDTESVSLNLELSEHIMAMLRFGSRLVVHTLDMCGNSSLMDFDISGEPPNELFDDNV